VCVCVHAGAKGCWGSAVAPVWYAIVLANATFCSAHSEQSLVKKRGRGEWRDVKAHRCRFWSEMGHDLIDTERAYFNVS
jgi:hypothetical protein